MRILLLFILSFSMLKLQSSESNSLVTPISVDGHFIGEGVSTISGGIKKGSALQSYTSIGLEASTGGLKLWKGGDFRLVGALTRGGNPSADLIGDFQVASNIEADNLAYFQEFWYKQRIDRWTFVVGLQDLNVFFVSSDAASLFINSSFGTPSTIATNVPSPIFPLTSFGAQLQYKLSNVITFKTAFFDGYPDDFSYNPHNLVWNLDASDGYLAFLEMEIASLKVGGYWHDHSITGPLLSSRTLNFGSYLVANTLLWTSTDGRELSSFLALGISPASRNTNNFYVGCGLHQKGILECRKNDLCGLAVAHSRLQHRSGGGETVIELTYKVILGENLFLQPDLQYIVNPAGTSLVLNHAMVGLLRFGIDI